VTLSVLPRRWRKRVTADYHLAMAGASHAGNSASHCGVWHRTLFDHLGFAVDEAKVAGVVTIDHLDCKAFHLYEGIPVGDLELERVRHVDIATELVREIVERFPALTGNVKVLLLPKEAKPDTIAER